MASYRKINLWGILSAIIVLLLMTGFHTYRNLTHLQEDARENAELRLKFANDVVNREIQSMEQTMVDISEPAMSFIEKGNKAELTGLLRDILGRHPYSFGCFVVLTADNAKAHHFPVFFGARREGTEIFPYEEAQLSNEDYAAEWFALPMEKKRDVWTDPYYSEILYRDTIISFCHPLLDSLQNPVALLVEDIPIDWLAQLLDVSEDYAGSKYMLVNTSGKVIMSSDGIQEVPSRHQYYIYSGEVGKRGSQITLAVPSSDIYRAALADAALSILVALAILLFAGYVFQRITRSARAQMVAETQKQLMEQELNIAHEIQMGMVPDKFPPFPERNELDIFAFMEPAHDIGGDFYDYFIRNEKLFFCIGDVSGKGIPASLLMAMSRTMFRTLSMQESQPRAIVSHINDGLKELSGRNMFVTLLLGVLDLPTGKLRYCNAGHNPPVILGADDCKTLPVIANLAAGIRKGYNYVQEDITLLPGQTVFLYTDGITEAKSPQGELYGMKRLTDTLSSLTDISPKTAISSVRKSVKAFENGNSQSDDMTMVAIRFTPCQEEILLSRTITVENKREDLARLHDFITGFSAEAGLSQKDMQAVDLCLEEAAANVVLYAYPYGSKGLLDVEARLTPERIVLILSDRGKPFDPTTLPEVDIKQRNKERQKGGLGIHLIRQNMDSINYERNDGQNVLTLSRLLHNHLIV